MSITTEHSLPPLAHEVWNELSTPVKAYDGTDGAQAGSPIRPCEQSLQTLLIEVETNAVVAAEIVGGVRETIIVATAFERIEEHPLNSFMTKVARHGLATAVERAKYRTAATYSGTASQKVSPAISASHDDAEAEYFDPKVQKAVRENALNARKAAADVPTGALPQTPLTMILPLQRRPRSSYVSQVKRLVGKTEVPKDYYAEVLETRKEALKISQAGRHGDLPGHTPTEVSVLLAELDAMAGDSTLTPAEVVEVTAVKTLVRSGHIPTVHTVPQLLRQRGLREAVWHITSHVARIAKGMGSLSLKSQTSPLIIN